MDILRKLPPQEGFTFEYEGERYNSPYETLVIDGVHFDGLRKTEDRFTLFDSILDEYVAPSNSYLDIGSNIGSFVNYYSRRFTVAEGIEKDQGIVSLGYEIYPGMEGRITIADMNSSRLNVIVSQRYDVVTLLSVIEYINNKQEFLSDLYEATNFLCIVEGHSEDIVPKNRDTIYEELLRELPWKVIRRPELTDAGLNAPKHSVGRPLWVCLK